ncbi:PREDICTED: uncharacterized protein LOC104718460 [Camelina sativa]|uniref:Uncharacterized protein LOC104718460 n=1 Tax=Camelina sativa TaxID=90675 RepID=A0ABM0U1M3_CAMSA|nr:PREDICTED: uncharacterized protein LOC104718460 [Camelina sativa]
MAKLEPVYADCLMDSRKRKGCNGVPLPYLIRPRRVLPPFDTFAFYNEYSSDDEGDSSMEEADKGHSDEEYVIVDNVVEALPNVKIEKAAVLQMMELCKDAVDGDGSESEDAGYKSDKSDSWVVV